MALDKKRLEESKKRKSQFEEGRNLSDNPRWHAALVRAKLKRTTARLAEEAKVTENEVASKSDAENAVASKSDAKQQ